MPDIAKGNVVPFLIGLAVGVIVVPRLHAAAVARKSAKG